MENKPSARIITLGCRLNHADSALLAGRLQSAGYTLTDDSSADAELIIVNCCAVTQEAETKSRKMIARLRRLHPGARIIAAGCAAEADPVPLLNAGADKILTNPGKKEPFADVCGVKSSTLTPDNFRENAFSSFPFRTRAFIKVQEGCDNFCTYCIVPKLRGPSRSREFNECIADCRKSIENGIPEIVLTGVNTGNYCDGGHSLRDLVCAVSGIEGNFRIRFSSTEPHPGDLTLPQLIADNSRLCRFLHVSMQHGSDNILRKMGRRYSAEEFAAYVEAARKLVPDIHIGTDFIVGFPGETEKDFTDALELLKKINFANIHGFAYSPRPGTPAAKMAGRPAPQAVKERMDELLRAADESAKKFALSQCGKTLPVIFEQLDRRSGKLTGWSDNYLEVAVDPCGTDCGKIVNIEAKRENLRLLNDNA